jgi:hypothetical protein
MAQEPTVLSVDYDDNRPSGAKLQIEGAPYHFVREGSWPAPIAVSDRLPELQRESNVSAPVLAYCADRGEWQVGRLSGINSFFGAPPVWAFDDRPIETEHVSHWLPLPAKPE